MVAKKTSSLPKISIIDAIESPKLLRPVFKDLSTWSAWMVILKAMFGIEMTHEELELFKTHTGRSKAPAREVREAWICAGRRSGKSWMSAVIASYLALLCDYSQYLSKGELASIIIVASDKAQSTIILRYILGIIKSNPVFAKLLKKEQAESIELSNGVEISVMACSYRSIRGRSVVACLADEISFWRSDASAIPDVEVLSAIRPSLATIPTSKLICISSPYSMKGAMYDAWKRYYGQDVDDLFVWQSPTRVLNATIDQKFIDRETEKDPAAAMAEWGGLFRGDLSSFLTPEVIDRAATLDGTLAPRGNRRYRCMVDASGGQNDSFTAAIAHREGDKIVIDNLMAFTPPLDPFAVAGEIAKVCKEYRISNVVGDKYSAGFVVSAFAQHGVKYNYSEKNKSELYLAAEGVFNTGGVAIPKDSRLLTELTQLERRTTRGGRDSVDHPLRGSDDRANAVVGAMYLLTTTSGSAFADCDLR